MSKAQQRLNVCFGFVISAVMACGLGRYAWLYYEDATAPPGVLAEGAFLEAGPELIVAVLLSALLGGVWAICYFWHRGNSCNT